MHAPVTKPMSFSHSPEQVFAAVIKTLEAGKYELASADAGTCRTHFPAESQLIKRRLPWPGI